MVADHNIIRKYFPQMTEEQEAQILQLGDIYKSENDKINVISRKDIDSLYLHHVLHSLSIAKFINFRDGTHVVDVGTGGGFPGIPLAILFPEVKFYMIDGRSKKISVVQNVVNALGLRNAIGAHKRSEELKGEFDFVLARAVTQLDKLIPQTFHLISTHQMNAIPNGLIALKGGDLKKEIRSVGKNHKVEVVEISSFFEEQYFEQKRILYVQG